jgi:hypothetical protein
MPDEEREHIHIEGDLSNTILEKQVHRKVKEIVNNDSIKLL